jgi:glycosyltransferase involved in cell wall biosynthesis
MRKSNPYLSVIIPLYNESKRLNGISTILNFLNKKHFKYEVLLINDGSTDTTLKKLGDYKKNKSIRIISYTVNKGKGYAIKIGMIQSLGEFCLFTDVDLSTPIEELDNFLPHLKKNDLVIGTRKKKGANLIRRQPILREFLGKIFTIISQMFLNSQISDFTCGFKCFSRKTANEIFRKVTIDRWGFDAEIIFIAKKKKHKIKEIPVAWTNNPQTRVKFPDAIFNSLYELIKIRYNDFRKIYD